ncbi:MULTISPECIES: phage late control D family protein [unclassified Cyanobium]|uniref:phage late control D family protein n=1 Tax=unclassified Cyanobium TaxID=2627006 RepID=UPI0020CCFCB9|nr:MULTISPECIES: contractile injection system protein, VgrG/Pvc8 family [unclassified Cyanobium]MCP9835697.1 phage late control D family protein [Cyanobium sp. La Preciosa 7G6]MCP9938478.1 phage late control D family protein [Cyanobium sp. Aljojuca 7A6]
MISPFEAPGLAGQPVLVPQFAITVEGIPLPPSLASACSSISVNQSANEPASFQLGLHDPQFLLIDLANGLFSEGRRIGIALGYAGALLPMIEGEITAIEVSLDESGGLSLSVEGFDDLHRASRTKESRTFKEGLSDSAIVREVVATTGLLPAVVADETPSRTAAEAQSEETTLSFLQRLATRNGFQLWSENRTLFFMRRRPGPALRFRRGRNLVSFSARLSTAGQAAAVEVRSWNAARQELISATAAANLSPAYLSALSSTGLAQVIGAVGRVGSSSNTRVIHAQAEVNSISEAQAQAEQEMNDIRRQLITTNGSVVGDPLVKVGSVVMLEGMGRFSPGPYVVQSASHRLAASGYLTSFSMRPDL